MTSYQKHYKFLLLYTYTTLHIIGIFLRPHIANVNVNSRSRSLYAVARPSLLCLSSVCLSSVTFVHPP